MIEKDDWQLPEDHMPTNNSLEMQALRQQLFVTTKADHPVHNNVITNGQHIYRDSDGTIERVYPITDPAVEGMASVSRVLFGQDIMWAHRLCNFLNAINGEELFRVSQPNAVTSPYENPQVFMSAYCQMTSSQFEFLENALILDNAAVHNKVAAMIPDPTYRQMYIDSPSSDTAWIGLTGTDPRDYDEPVIGGRDEYSNDDIEEDR